MKWALELATQSVTMGGQSPWLLSKHINGIYIIMRFYLVKTNFLAPVV